VKAIKEDGKGAKLAYLAHAPTAQHSDVSEEAKHWIGTQLPQAVVIPGEFGPDLVVQEKSWNSWRSES
jgi:hypothetical protein